MGPGLSHGTFGEPVDRVPQGGCFQRAGQVDDFTGQVPDLLGARRPSRHPAVRAAFGGQTQSDVVVTERALFDLRFGDWPDQPDQFSAQQFRSSQMVRIGEGLMLGPDPWMVGDQPALT